MNTKIHISIQTAATTVAGLYFIHHERNIVLLTDFCKSFNKGRIHGDDATFTLTYRDGRMANLQSTAIAANDLQGIISCENGFLVVDNINNPQTATVYNVDHEVLQVHNADGKITGYEYQVFACEEALANGWLESPYMPHAETVKIMKMMDALRKEWGVVYPNDSRCLEK